MTPGCRGLLLLALLAAAPAAWADDPLTPEEMEREGAAFLERLGPRPVGREALEARADELEAQGNKKLREVTERAESGGEFFWERWIPGLGWDEERKKAAIRNAGEVRDLHAAAADILRRQARTGETPPDAGTGAPPAGATPAPAPVEAEPAGPAAPTPAPPPVVPAEPLAEEPPEPAAAAGPTSPSLAPGGPPELPDQDG